MTDSDQFPYSKPTYPLLARIYTFAVQDLRSNEHYVDPRNHEVTANTMLYAADTAFDEMVGDDNDKSMRLIRELYEVNTAEDVAVFARAMEADLDSWPSLASLLSQATVIELMSRVPELAAIDTRRHGIDRIIRPR